jgi:hypothetical protein
VGAVISHPIGPRWKTTSWKDAVWADRTWGAAATVPDVVIGAGSDNGTGGLMLYAAMRMAEAQRRHDEKPIDSLVSPIVVPAPVVIPPIVVPARPVQRITRVAPLELHDVAVDKKRELKAALESPKPEPVAKPVRVYPKTGYAEVPLELVGAAPPPAQRAMGAVAPDLATQLAEQHREALEEEELAMVLLLAA